MSQIDREMGQTERRYRPVTLLSTVGGFVPPLYGALAPRPLREPWLATAWRSLDAALRHAVDVILTWRERARTRRQLLTFDDRLLKDIGITRLDARSEAEKPFWQV
jgi:uncharacterized protein YjiS (DUF1127 family)